MIKNTFKDLIVWQKGIELVVAIYELTDNFPASEMYGLTSQMRRGAVSIPSNIAEGKMRKSQAECNHFFTISYGSGAELETQIEIAKRLSFGKDLDYKKTESLLSEVMRMLNTLIS